MTADSPSGIRSLTPYFTLNGHSQNPRRQTLNPLTSAKNHAMQPYQLGNIILMCLILGYVSLGVQF